MKIIQWNKLLDEYDTALFHCNNCFGMNFQPVQTLSFKNINKEKSTIMPIQYVECINCKAIYALIQEELNEFKIQTV